MTIPMFTRILNHLLPKQCLSCHSFIPTNWICSHCLQSLEPKQALFSTPETNIPVISFFKFESVIKELLHYLKFEHMNELSSIISPLLPALPSADIVIPTPIHRRRLKERGYNQVEVIFKPLFDQLTPCIHRHKHTPPLFKLSQKKRKSALINAFSITDIHLEQKTVLLIDDIFTSGTTFEAMIQCILPKRPKSITCLSICHA